MKLEGQASNQVYKDHPKKILKTDNAGEQLPVLDMSLFAQLKIYLGAAENLVFPQLKTNDVLKCINQGYRQQQLDQDHTKEQN